MSKQNIKNKELKQLSQTHNRINYESPRNYIIAITLGILCFLLGYINLHNGQTWSGEDGGNGDFSQYLLQIFSKLLPYFKGILMSLFKQINLCGHIHTMEMGLLSILGAILCSLQWESKSLALTSLC